MVVANRIDGTSQTDTGTKSLHHACMHAAVGIRMKMEAFTAKPASSTNFTHCLIVPDLLLACACALQTWPPVDDAGIGLKRLHLLSRETCAACDVQGYTLRLVLPAVGQEAFSASAHDLSDPKLCAFLSRPSLLRLHVSIPPFIQGMHPQTAASITATAHLLAAQLQQFATNVGPALSSVTHLTITLPYVGDTKGQRAVADAGFRHVLSSLAVACPHLRNLAVVGPLQPQVLRQFGSLCPNLCSLQGALTNTKHSTLTELGNLLPHLTSLAEHPSPAYSPSRSKSESVRTGLTACSCLTNLDIGGVQLTAGVWRALPKGLRSLACSIADSRTHPLPQPIDWRHLQQHAGLQTIQLANTGLDLSHLVALLSHAPNVDVLRIHEPHTLRAECTRAAVQDLHFLDRRVLSGLKLVPFHQATPTGLSRCSFLLFLCHPPSLESSDDPWLSDDCPSPDTDASSDLHNFVMAKLLATSVIEGPLCSFTNVRFHHSGDHPWSVEDMSQLPRAFPNVEVLGLEHFTLEPQLEFLASCASLRALTLTNITGVSRLHVESLCARSQSLRSVTLLGCRVMSVEDGAWVASIDNKLSGVDLVVERGADLEAEDASREVGKQEGSEEVAA